jgi:wyosine [tRNA(Phe)-imidazoG37] synthetase (radical SAM superfamily)
MQQANVCFNRWLVTQIAALLRQIQPDEVHILKPDRPAAETWVEPPDEVGLLRSQANLGDVARLVHPANGTFDLCGAESLVDAIIGIITRHPMRQEEIEQTLARWSPDEVTHTLKNLAESDRARW